MLVVLEGPPFFILNLEASGKKTVDKDGVPNVSVITPRAAGERGIRSGTRRAC